jgi:hypothetical protein
MGAMRNSLRNGLRFAKTSPGITAVAAFTKIGFGQSFAIGAYAFVPILLKDLLALVMFWAHPPGGGVSEVHRFPAWPPTCPPTRRRGWRRSAATWTFPFSGQLDCSLLATPPLRRRRCVSAAR